MCYRKKVWTLELSFPCTYSLSTLSFFPLLTPKEMRNYYNWQVLHQSDIQTQQERADLLFSHMHCSVTWLRNCVLDPQINTFVLCLSLFPQSISKMWPLPAQLKIAAQTIVLYILNFRPSDLDPFKNSSTKVTFLIHYTEHVTCFGSYCYF